MIDPVVDLVEYSEYQGKLAMWRVWQRGPAVLVVGNRKYIHSETCSQQMYTHR